MQDPYVKQLVTGPAAEPVSRTEAKLHCRIEHSVEDTYIDGLITMAREYVEGVTGLSLVTQTWKLLYEEWPEEDEGEEYLYLGCGPVQSVTHIKYTDYSNTVTTWASTNYVLDGLNNPPRIGLAYGKLWPVVTLQTGRPIEVQIVCGFGDASAVPNRIKQAMFLIIGAMYENRSDVVLGNNASADSKRLVFGVEALLADYMQQIA